MNNLGTWLKEKLEAKGMSVGKLAYETGLSRAIIYYYLSDVNRPTKENMEKICNVLGVNTEEGMKMFTPKKNGRPIGSSKKWGEELISKNNINITPSDSLLSTERYII